MGFLLKKKTSTEPPKISNISYTSVTYGTPIPLVYGTNKISTTVLDYLNLVAHPVSSGGDSGGKGGGGGGSSTTSWTYTAYALLALCQGAIKGVGRIWNNSTLTTLAHEAMWLYLGTSTQLPWGAMPASKALPYRNLAYVAGNLNLGDNPNIPSYNFEVHGLLALDTSTPLTSTEYAQKNADSGIVGSFTYQPAFSNCITSTASMSVSYRDSNGNSQIINNYVNYALQFIAATSTTPQYQQYLIDLTPLNTSNAVVTITYNYSTNFDANVNDIVFDFLTNTTYGNSFPTEYYANTINFRNYCIAAGMFFSPALTSQDQAATLAETWVTAANGEFVFSQGMLNIIPLGDTTITGNGVTWTPDLTPIYNLTIDDFLNQDEPITCTRSMQAETWNSCSIEYCNRANNYNTEIVPAQDLANIETFGMRPADVLTANFICSTSVAKKVCQLLLDRSVSTRNKYVFKLPINFVLLDPLDIVSITLPEFGLNNKLVRITSITESDDCSLEFEAIEVLVGCRTPATYHVQQTTRETRTNLVDPGNTNPIIVFEPPFGLTNDTLQIMVGASGQNMWGGCTVWISNDGETYKQVGKITQPCRQGNLSSALSYSVDPDITNTLSVDVSMSSATLLSGTQSDADNNVTLCYVDGELIAYQTATLTSEGNYDLTYLRRGQYGSTVNDHTMGTQFCRIDNTLVQIPFNQSQIGTQLRIKVTSFNVFQSGEQSLDDVHPYIYTIKGTALTESPGNVNNLVYYYQNGNNNLRWDVVQDGRKLLYEVRMGTSWDNGIIVGQYTQNSMTVNGSGLYWIKALISVGSIYSEFPTSVNVVSPRIPENVIATYDESAGWLGGLQNCYVGLDNRIYGQLPVNSGIQVDGGDAGTYDSDLSNF